MKTERTLGWLIGVAMWLGSEMVEPRLAGAERAAPGDKPRPIQPVRFGFTAAANGEFLFDTGVLRGKLRAGGKSLGLSSVVHIPSGLPLDRSNGLFSHYRVFSGDTRYGVGAWDWPSVARLLEDGAVEVQWPAATNRPFEMTATYRWAAEATLDLETVVKPGKDLPGFEVFLASYFSEPFTNCLVYVKDSPGKVGQAGFLAATKPLGDWQMFPKDGSVVPLIKDGRWTLEPNPVNWIVMPEFRTPLAMRRDAKSGLTAVLMAPPTDCFAIATPYEAEGHRSLYFSLFGRGLKAGEQARARSRLVIATNPTEQQVIALEQAYHLTTGRRSTLR